jgi:hypothetical protein
MNKLLSATVGLATLGYVGAVQAAPMLFVQVYETTWW